VSDPNGPHRQGLEEDLRRVRRLEWLNIAYLFTSITFLVLVMSGSQALKTEFVGDALGLIAPTLFLVGGKISARKPDKEYPFGYERAVAVGNLGAALALLAVGLYLFADAALKLVRLERPIIGGMELFGHVVWIGWLAVPALMWCAIPAYFFGRTKQKLAERIHDKVLASDAETSAANWKSAAAAVVGIFGVALGYWWADAVAALFISLEIVHSGWDELTHALGDLIDRRPRMLGNKEVDPLPEKLTQFIKQQDWIEDAVVRVRERGRELEAEAVIVPSEDAGLPSRLEALSRDARMLDERLRHLGIMPVRNIPVELNSVRAER